MAATPKKPIPPRRPIPDREPGPLTPAEQMFVSLYLHNGHLFEAYRGSFDCEGITLATMKYRALCLVNSRPIKAVLAAFRKEAIENNTYTLDDHITELDNLRNLAIEMNDTKTAVRLVELKGKALGHYAERTYHTETQNINHGGEITITFVDA